MKLKIQIPILTDIMYGDPDQDQNFKKELDLDHFPTFLLDT